MMSYCCENCLMTRTRSCYSNCLMMSWMTRNSTRKSYCYSMRMTSEMKRRMKSGSSNCCCCSMRMTSESSN